MPLHPTAEMMVQVLADAGMTFKADATPEDRREMMNAMTANGVLPKQPVGAVEDRSIPGPAGEIPVRVYSPEPEPEPEREGADLPLLVWFHGGGWVTGNIETHDQVCRMLCDASGAAVASVDYRLAPEAKFPAALDDCVAAYEWALQQSPAVAIGGDSAGGNLAAVVALVARERGLPQPKLQLLVYPVTDYEFESPAMIDNAKGYFLEAESMRWFYGHYARDDSDYDDWRFSPLRAPDHSGLAPAVVITAEFDPLRDQGEWYAARLRDAGVPTQHVRADGLIHGFFGMHEFMPPGVEAWNVSVAALHDALEV